MSNIFFTADGRKIDLERFGDVAPSTATTQSTTTPTATLVTIPSAKELEDSLRLKGNLSLDGTIRAGRFLMADGSEMKTVVNETKVAAVPETVSFDAQGSMTVGSKVNTNKLKFSTQWTGFPDDKKDGAEISNDTDNYKTLMIVGNKSAGGPRSVSVWDKLTVNGQLCVEDKCVDKKTFGASGTGYKVGGPDNINKYSLDDNNVNTIGTEKWWTVFRQHSNEGWKFNDQDNKTMVQIKSGTGNVAIKGQLEVNNGSRFMGDRHFFTDAEGKGLLRVGAAWGVPGIYAEQGDVVVGSQTGNIWLNGNTKTNVLQLGEKFRMSGVGDGAANDDWLRLFNKENNNYYGGFAAGRLWTNEGKLTGSDKRMKTDIEELNSKQILEKVNKLKAYTYRLKHSKKDTRKYGLIAQELQKEFPEMVEEGPNGLLAIDYDQVSALLLEAINALSKK